MKTSRGFEVIHFNDDYGVDCSIQESSAVEPHIWLGVHKPEIKIMYKDLDKVPDIHITHDKDSPAQGGWCTINIPNEAHIFSRMHLNKKQAKVLIKQLKYFIRHGYLKEEII